MEDNREIEIDFRKLFSMLKRKLVFIILITIIGAIASGCITNFFITPKYTATVKLHAWSNSEKFMSSNGSISDGEYSASEKLVNTYLVVVTSDTLLEKVAAKIGNGITVSQLKSMVSCSQITDTIAFRVSVTSADPKQAAEIANIIAEICPNEIVRILKVGGVEVIDYAKEPSSPSSPNLKKNILIGLVAGFAVSFAFFFIKELFDTSITDEEDLIREFSLPIIGTVPKLVPVNSKAVTPSVSIDPPKPPLNIDVKEDK